MANSFYSGTMYIDSTGSLTTQQVKVAYALFIPSANNDSVTLLDGNGGSVKLIAEHNAAHEMQRLDFSRKPVLFKNGVYCSAISSGAKLLLYTTTEGAST